MKSRLVFDKRAIDAAVAQVAAAVTARVADRDPVIVSVLLGALPFTAALIERLDFSLQLDYAQLSRYRGETEGGALTWLREPSVPLAGRSVLIVDDVLDAGDTLVELVRWCRAAGAADVLSAVLVEKRSAVRPLSVAADFVGLHAGDGYLFGFGMDYRERHRQLPEIRELIDG